MFKTVQLMMNWPVCTQMPFVSIGIFGAGCKLTAYVINLYKGCGDHCFCSARISLPFWQSWIAAVPVMSVVQ